MAGAAGLKAKQGLDQGPQGAHSLTRPLQLPLQQLGRKPRDAEHRWGERRKWVGEGVELTH